MKRLALFLVLALTAAHGVAMTAAVRPDQASDAGRRVLPAHVSGADSVAGRP